MCSSLTKLTQALALIATNFVLVSAVQASAPELIERLECEACHGPGGVSQNTDIPSIAGLPEFNFVDQMLKYGEGRPAGTVNHVHGDTSKTGDMGTIVKSLSEEEVEELAAHYSQLEFVRAKQSFDQSLADKGKMIHEKNCSSCHVDGGSDPMDESSILAGQQKGYLLTTLKQFHSGARSVDKKMDDAIKALSSDDLVALSEYYASYQ
ncbi:Cytochrome C oxidase [Vibrio sp. B1FLJ16]|nr:Cytochrome C oxidase [Vibrio sp. B1FLJ16]CAD7804241.1 Cytochrome C oxidase [Vibrio sp. B1FLJ16]CAE6896455.1 Cytochrome C oxidase [Vibrio sp. B1FLJ16]CAE6897749.1 Cytochrome C oxidase [Vibrio sp. B1FLJ16]